MQLIEANNKNWLDLAKFWYD